MRVGLLWAAGPLCLVPTTSALAMDQCPPGTGSSPWAAAGMWAGLVLMVVFIILRCTVLRTRPGEPRPPAQALVVLAAILSPCGGLVATGYGILICAPQTQAPEVVCEHFAEQAERSREPVGFDEEVCLRTWRAERERLSTSHYRELSSCAVRTSLWNMHQTSCTQKGFELSRHAPGAWPATEDVQR
ncbi:MAG: hypothetical protein KDK70_27120 [Myxococcales bacterium]|nr:hypothetical protein [Myxococcales bacterium]